MQSIGNMKKLLILSLNSRSQAIEFKFKSYYSKKNKIKFYEEKIGKYIEKKKAFFIKFSRWSRKGP